MSVALKMPEVPRSVLGCALIGLYGAVGLAAQAPPDTLWRPESGMAMLVWDSVVSMSAAGEPLDTVALPFGNIAAFRSASGAGPVRVLRDGAALSGIGSPPSVFGMWFDDVEVGEVARFDACAPVGTVEQCWSVAVRRPADPEIVVIAPGVTLADPTYRHRGRTVAGRGSMVSHGRRPPADTIEVAPGDRLEVRVSPQPDSVVASLHERSPAMPEFGGDPTTRLPPEFVWVPTIPDGEAMEWLVCAWWGAGTHECRVVGLRGVGEFTGR